MGAGARAGAREAEALQATIAAEGGNFQLKAWDWRYYAEKRRKALYDIDESELRPYLPLDGMIAAAFDVADRLFGLSFVARRDVRRLTRTRAPGRPWGAGARRSLCSSATISPRLEAQRRLDERVARPAEARRTVLPIIVNVMSFARGGAGEACLLGLDEAHTLFHEFGHALHGMLSDVTYPLLAGTHVARDFVELPRSCSSTGSSAPAAPFRPALRTGEPMPEALIERLGAARRLNQGFATTEFIASALFDMELHLIGDASASTSPPSRPRALGDRHAERDRFPPLGAAFPACLFRRRLFRRLLQLSLVGGARRRRFRGVRAVGRRFDPALAEQLKRFIYSAGNTREPDEAYRGFRGRDPSPDALLRKRGLVES